MTQVRTSLKVLALALSIPTVSLAQQDAKTVVDSGPVFVQTMIVPPVSETVSRQFYGQVAALETVDISFEVGGFLQVLNAREGAAVPRGAVLAELDSAPFERGVERAELNLAQAERDLERARTLAQRNVASQVQADNAATARDLADVALREAREALSDSQITAPFDAIVADRLGTAFTTIEPGTPILRLHNMSEMRVEFDVPERLFARIGDPSAVRFVGQLPHSKDPIPLEFREFRAETRSIGQSYRVSLAIVPSDVPALLPGRSITVRAEMRRDNGSIVVPASAVATLPDNTTVVVALRNTDAGLVAQHIPVVVSSPNGTQFSIEGVAPGTEIVSTGAHMVANNQPLKRFRGLTLEGS